MEMVFNDNYLFDVLFESFAWFHIHLNLVKIGSLLFTTLPSSNTNWSLVLSYVGILITLAFFNYLFA